VNAKTWLYPSAPAAPHALAVVGQRRQRIPSGVVRCLAEFMHGKRSSWTPAAPRPPRDRVVDLIDEAVASIG